MEKTEKIILLGIVPYLVAVILTLLVLLYFRVPLSQKTDSEAVNGILTASAVIFAFSTFRLKKIGKLLEWVLFFNFLGQMFVLAVVGLVYFTQFLQYGYTTIEVMAWAEMSLMINLFGSIFNLIVGSILEKSRS